jgi:N-methylhydantoinase A/oxoprolinase/acetone carboxylase beta subunit
MAQFVKISTIPDTVGRNPHAAAWQVLGGSPRIIREERVIGRIRPRIVLSGSVGIVLEKSNTLQQILPKKTTVFLAVN